MDRDRLTLIKFSLKPCRCSQIPLNPSGYYNYRQVEYQNQFPTNTGVCSISILQYNLRGASRKYRTFCHTKIFIDNRKEKEYAGFITHLHLLIHIVTLDIEALAVP